MKSKKFYICVCCFIFACGGLLAYKLYKDMVRSDVEEQLEIADKYYTGNGVVKNYKEAFKYYKKAAENGNANAQYMLAGMYYTGEGGAKDLQEMYKWYKKAAEQGHSDAQYIVGLEYYSRSGIAKDYKKAFE